MYLVHTKKQKKYSENSDLYSKEDGEHPVIKCIEYDKDENEISCYAVFAKYYVIEDVIDKTEFN